MRLGEVRLLTKRAFVEVDSFLVLTGIEQIVALIVQLVGTADAPSGVAEWLSRFKSGIAVPVFVVVLPPPVVRVPSVRVRSVRVVEAVSRCGLLTFVVRATVFFSGRFA